jgi:hypothetical protein
MLEKTLFVNHCELIGKYAQILPIFAFFKVFCIFTKFTIKQMLHGCRPDLILKCLVNSKKGRNFHS